MPIEENKSTRLRKDKQTAVNWEKLNDIRGTQKVIDPEKGPENKRKQTPYNDSK